MDVRNAYVEGSKDGVFDSQQQKRMDKLKRKERGESEGTAVEMRQGRDMTDRLRELYKNDGDTGPRRPSIIDPDAGEMEDVPLNDEEEEEDAEWEDLQ